MAYRAAGQGGRTAAPRARGLARPRASSAGAGARMLHGGEHPASAYVYRPPVLRPETLAAADSRRVPHGGGGAAAAAPPAGSGVAPGKGVDAQYTLSIVVPVVASPPPPPRTLSVAGSTPVATLLARVGSEVRRHAASSPLDAAALLAGFRVWWEGCDVQAAAGGPDARPTVARVFGRARTCVLVVEFPAVAEALEAAAVAAAAAGSAAAEVSGTVVQRPASPSPSRAAEHEESLTPVGLREELREALCHLDVLRCRVDTHAAELKKEKGRRVAAEERLQEREARVDGRDAAVDSLVAKYADMVLPQMP